MNVYLFVFLVFISSFFLTYLLRRYALHKNVIDVPNQRSSHSVPTPRGGGVAIVLSFLFALPLVGLGELAEWSTIWALLMSASGIALLGFLDDHGHIAARWRLLGHLAAAICALVFLGGVPPLTTFGFPFDSVWLGLCLAIIYIVWFLNLYNFMDGIDGLASIEAICVTVSAAFLYSYVNLPDAAVLPLLLAASVAGFLLWNFPSAKIFMGDAGSGFLGFVLAVLSIQAAWFMPELFWSWVILMGIFVVDATFTLLHRLKRGEKVYEAHRSHAYQNASRHYRSHKSVSIVIGMINLFWLFPWAFIVASSKLSVLLALIIAYAPLVVLAIKFKAGAKEKV